MGEKKAIIFSTHILEEVDAACTRAIIIDRGQIVANGTPAELRGKSDMAGAVLVRVSGVGLSELREKLNGVGPARRTMGIGEQNGIAQVRVYPKSNVVNGELAHAIGELAVREKWKVEELHTEEGRLDEVFRSITLPETEAVTSATKAQEEVAK
jgi:ABC-2 type transport system ATP-binding protein